MTNRELLEGLFRAAAEVYDRREAQSVARFIAERLYGISRIEAVLEPEKEVRADDLEKVIADLSAGRPAQYITGCADFCGMSFEVEEGVLIPRPETEELVDWVVGETAPGAALLDVGTGSGAIAVALAKRIADSEVWAVDLSERAVLAASRNAFANDVRITLLLHDILAEADPWGAESFDAVVSNPPYIPQRDKSEMHVNVTDYEPHEALFVPDDDPLLFYRTIARKGLRLLKGGGRLYFEIYEHASAEIAALLAQMGYEGVEVRRDINDRERMVKAVKK